MKTSKPAQSQQKAPDVVIRTCPLYNETAAAKAREYPGLGQKILDFQKFKSENKLSPYGKSDKLFRTDGNFSGLKHAHLTHDLSIIYSMSGSNPTVIDLYGVFSHDDIGTGQPANIKRQKSMGPKIKGQSFK